jgi:5-methylcytosine-specific restriction endonuclease McrA
MDDNEHPGSAPATPVAAPVTAAEIGAFMTRLTVASPADGDEERIDRIGALEALKAAAAAAQVHDLVAFADSQVDDQAARGVKARDRGSGIGAQVGLATRNSPHRGSRMLATARALVTDLPHTLAALARGETSEHRATLVAKETSVLDGDGRRRVDAELATRLPDLGDRRVEAEARAWVYRLDPHAAVARAAKARADRRVTCRPAPDTMTYLTGLLPVGDGVAVYAALDAAAKAAAAAGDNRSRGQVMADTLVQRVTGVTGAEQPVEVQLIITDTTLLGGGDEPAQVPGYGPIPAGVARRWILSLLDTDTDEEGEDDTAAGAGDRADRDRTRRARFEQGRLWLRRLYTTPDGKHLVALDSTRRSFPRLLRRLIEYRDRICATPYCGAPIRHIDHTVPHRDGGPTSYTNGRGVCAACNHAKEAPGWTATVTDTTLTRTEAQRPERAVTLTTPTGHTYRSSPPPVGVSAVPA